MQVQLAQCWAGHFQCQNMNIYFSIIYLKVICHSKVIAKSVVVLNYLNADCSLKIIVSFIIIFGTLSFLSTSIL